MIGGHPLTRVAVLAIAVAFVAGCATRPVTTVTISGESWDLLEGGQDGMRGLDGFSGADGMLFRFDDDTDPDFVGWVMDGVGFPLDIAWFDGDGVLLGTATMPMCPAEPCPVHRAPAPYRWAVETPVGAFDGLPPDAVLVVPPD